MNLISLLVGYCSLLPSMVNIYVHKKIYSLIVNYLTLKQKVNMRLKLILKFCSNYV